ncbi:MAG: chemotaxis protein CheW [Gammaproteobacteria bacterium]|nr:chemotaxis protein CheW [Gammaproteobacteria bacterium]
MAGPILNPLQLLKEIDLRCRRFLKQTTTGQARQASLLAIHVGDYNLCIESRFIEEILSFSRQTRLSAIPNAKPWHKGLTSIRGQLLNVIDLKTYLLEKTTEISPGTRLILIRTGDFRSGIIVDSAQGLFPATETSQNGNIALSPTLKDICRATMTIEGQLWMQLDIERLFSDPYFVQATQG